MKENSYQPLARRKWTHEVVAAIFFAMFKVFARLHVTGRENVPKSGPFVVVSNHLNNLDSILILVVFPRWVNFMGKEELFSNKILAGIMRWAHVFPVQRGEGIRGKREAIRTARFVLEKQMLLGMFPEGTRSRTFQLKEALPGPMFIALESKTPLLPVAITGSQRLHGFWFFKRPAVSITIGTPFTPPSANGSVSKDILASATTYTMGRIAALLPPEYRGIYGAADIGATPRN